MSTSSPTDASPVLAVGIPGATAERIGRDAGVAVVLVGADQLERALSAAPRAAVIAGGGPELAQRVHRVAPAASVLFLAADDRAKAGLDATLPTLPGIGRHTRAFTGPSAIAEVVEEIGWARRRLEHERTLSSIRSLLPRTAADGTAAASRYLGQLFDHAPIGILIADPSGAVLAANPRSGVLTGRAAADLVGHPVGSLFAGGDAALARDLVADCTSTGSAVVQTLSRTGPEGGPQHLEVTVAPVDPDLTSMGVIVLLHDETARMRALEAAEHARRQAELAAERHADLSRTLQRSLLPPQLPSIPGVTISTRYHAAGDGTLVGGDFYDVFPLPDGRWCIVLGDVSGKGVEAATVTSLARYSLRAAASMTASVDGMFRLLNRLLMESTLDRFCTLAALCLAPDGSVEVVLAGHPAPMVVRRDGRLEVVGIPAPPLGLFATIELHAVGTALAPGDSVVVTSDGVTEVRTPSGEFVPDLLDRVLPAVAGRGAGSIADAIDAAVLAVERSRTRDDVAIVVISREDDGGVRSGWLA